MTTNYLQPFFKGKMMLWLGLQKYPKKPTILNYTLTSIFSLFLKFFTIFIFKKFVVNL